VIHQRGFFLLEEVLHSINCHVEGTRSRK